MLNSNLKAFAIFLQTHRFPALATDRSLKWFFGASRNLFGTTINPIIMMSYFKFKIITIIN